MDQTGADQMGADQMGADQTSREKIVVCNIQEVEASSPEAPLILTLRWPPHSLKMCGGVLVLSESPRGVVRDYPAVWFSEEGKMTSICLEYLALATYALKFPNQGKPDSPRLWAE